MFEKPPTIEGKEKEKQRTIEMGSKAVEQELALKNPSKRSALVLATFLAMFGAIGEAQADWKSVVLGPRGVSGTIAGEVGGTIDQRERNKRQEIDNEYLEQKQAIMLNLRALENNYRQEKDKYQRAGDQRKLDELEQNYKKERAVLTKLSIDNEKQYRSKLLKQQIRQKAKEQVMIGVRGW